MAPGTLWGLESCGRAPLVAQGPLRWGCPGPRRPAGTHLEGVLGLLGSQAPLWAGVRLPSCSGVCEP